MDRAQTIVVGVDFSDCSKSALVQARRIAAWNNASLHVIHVIESLVAAEVAESLGGDEDEARAQIKRDAAKHLESWVAAAGGPDMPAGLQLDVRIGSPVHEILTTVEDVNADCLVLGVFGVMGALGGTGTLAIRCARSSPVKVLLVNEAHPRPYRTVIVAVDFSETSDAAIEQALRVAARDGSEVRLLHVFSAPWHRLHYQAPTPEASPDFRRQYTDALTSRLEACRNRFDKAAKEAGVQVGIELFEAPSYGRGIVEYAEQTKADLVVLGTRGRTNLRYLLLGTTAERVLRELRCSVLSVKPQG